MTAAPFSLPNFAAAMVSGVLPLWQERHIMELGPKSFGVLCRNSLLLMTALRSTVLSRCIKFAAGTRAPKEPPQPT